MPEIIIDVSPAGKVNLEVNGVKGKSCTDATAEIEIVLGGAAKSTKKPDYYRPPMLTGKNSNKLTF